jgi:hypothetical protein
MRGRTPSPCVPRSLGYLIVLDNKDTDAIWLWDRCPAKTAKSAEQASKNEGLEIDASRFFGKFFETGNLAKEHRTCAVWKKTDSHLIQGIMFSNDEN